MKQHPNPIVEMALKALAEAGIGAWPPEQTEPDRVREAEAQAGPEAGSQKPASPAAERQAEVVSALPDSVLTSRNPIATLARLALDSLPAAHKLNATERRILADSLEAAALRWLATVFESEYAWEATCPRGHDICDGIFARCLLGWSCPNCQQVYPARECKLKIHEVHPK